MYYNLIISLIFIFSLNSYLFALDTNDLNFGFSKSEYKKNRLERRYKLKIGKYSLAAKLGAATILPSLSTVDTQKSHGRLQFSREKWLQYLESEKLRDKDFEKDPPWYKLK